MSESSRPPPPTSTSVLLQNLQAAHPQAQVAILDFSADHAEISLAHKGVPVHTEHFPELSGVQLLASCFSDSSSRAAQLEHAIEVVEDAIMPASLDLRQFMVFAAGEFAEELGTWLHEAQGSEQHIILNRDTIDDLFTLYAAASQGATKATSAVTQPIKMVVSKALSTIHNRPHQKVLMTQSRWLA
uniref:FtsZ_C domain-containing protein n=1 Tax=Steinernema glaseri TaxID=37863 RepID=A0A1I8ATM2_9BILA